MNRVLPMSPPYRVSALFYRRQRGLLGLTALGMLLSLSVVWIAAGQARDLARERRIWEAGTTAQQVEVTGRETTKYGVWQSAKLLVRFTDAIGTVRTEPVEFDALGFLQADQRALAELRYLDGNPSAVALSWAVAAAPNRVAWSVVLAAVGVAFTLGCGRALTKTVMKTKTVEGCARNGKEVRLLVVSSQAFLSRGVTSVEYRLRFSTPSGETVNLKAADQFGVPLFLNPEGTEVLGLLSSEAPRDPVVLAASGMPFGPETVAQRGTPRPTGGKVGPRPRQQAD